MGVTKIKKTITCEGALYEDGELKMTFDDHHLAGLIAVLSANDPIEELTEEENKLDPFKMK